MTESQDDEVARLRAQVGELEAKLAGGEQPQTSSRTGWWRPAVVVVLLVLVGLMAPLSVVAVWAHDQVSDTDRYVETITPLASDPAIQDAMVNRVTNELFTRLDIEAVTQEAIDALSQRGLPPRAAAGLSALAVPLTNGIRGFVEDKVADFVKSDAFQQAWIEANRAAHGQLVAVLTGQTNGAVQVSGNTVSVNLAAVIDVIKQRLVEAGFTIVENLPPINATFTLFESSDITKVQNGFDLLSSLARVLPWLAVLLLLVAVFVARDRRRALLAGALVVAASMILLGLGLNLGRSIYLDRLPEEVQSPPAAAAIFDTLVHFIRVALRSVLVLFLIVAAVAWVTGSATAPAAVRRGTSTAIGSVRNRSRLNTGAFGATVYQMKNPLRFGILGLALLIYVLAAHPTAGFTITLFVIALLLLLVVEVVAQPPPEQEAVPADAATPAP
jgi:hypothetical protein